MYSLQAVEKIVSRDLDNREQRYQFLDYLVYHHQVYSSVSLLFHKPSFHTIYLLEDSELPYDPQLTRVDKMLLLLSKDCKNPCYYAIGQEASPSLAKRKDIFPIAFSNGIYADRNVTTDVLSNVLQHVTTVDELENLRLNKKLFAYTNRPDVLNSFAAKFGIKMPIINFEDLYREYSKIHATSRCIYSRAKCLENAIKDDNFSLVERYIDAFQPDMIQRSVSVEMLHKLVALYERRYSAIQYSLGNPHPICLDSKGNFSIALYQAFKDFEASYYRTFSLQPGFANQNFQYHSAIDRAVKQDIDYDFGTEAYQNVNLSLVGANYFKYYTPSILPPMFLRNFRPLMVIEWIKSHPYNLPLDQQLEEAILQVKVDGKEEDDPSLVKFLVEQKGAVITRGILQVALNSWNSNILEYLMIKSREENLDIVDRIEGKNFSEFYLRLGNITPEHVIKFLKQLQRLFNNDSYYNICEKVFSFWGWNECDDISVYQFILETNPNESFEEAINSNDEQNGLDTIIKYGSDNVRVFAFLTKLRLEYQDKQGKSLLLERFKHYSNTV